MSNQVLAVKELNRVNQRLAGMTAIDPKLDLGGGISVPSVTKSAADLQAAINVFHQSQSALEANRVQIKNLVLDARDVTERVLSGVAARYGKNSEEYRKVGGKLKRDRKKSVRGPRKSAPQKLAAAPAVAKPTTPAVAPVPPASSISAPPPAGAPGTTTNGHSA